jgi:hypothetical protein
MAVGVAALLLLIAAVLTLRAPSRETAAPAATVNGVVPSAPAASPPPSEPASATDLGVAASVESNEVPAPAAVDAGAPAVSTAPAHPKGGALATPRPPSSRERPPKLDADPWAH